MPHVYNIKIHFDQRCPHVWLPEGSHLQDSTSQKEWVLCWMHVSQPNDACHPGSVSTLFKKCELHVWRRSYGIRKPTQALGSGESKEARFRFIASTVLPCRSYMDIVCTSNIYIHTCMYVYHSTARLFVWESTYQHLDAGRTSFLANVSLYMLEPQVHGCDAR